MTDLLSRMDAALALEVDGRHSRFQMEHFILGKELTHQGRCWQCLKEIRSRRSSLQALELEAAEAKDQVELLNIQVEAEVESRDTLFDKESEMERKYRLRTSVVVERQLRRKLESATRNLGSLLEQQRRIEEEAAFFTETFEKLNEMEPVRPLDDVAAQKEYWGVKLANDVHLRTLIGQPLDVELVKTVLSLNNDSPIKAQMIKMLEQARDERLKIEG